jgi:hypothetical protein
MAGRPTDYKPEYCDMLIDHMGQGYSFESFAGLVDVARSTIYEWVENQPDFSDAKSTAFEKSRLFWEKAGIDGLFSETEYDEKGKPTKSRSLNSTVWIFNMKNRFKDEWREKQEIKHEGNPDAPVIFKLDDRFRTKGS